jgi:ABC-2 type transport system ATP-binding protein
MQSLKNRGITILLTTHYIEEADRLCDRVAIIVKGRIIVIDTPEALKKSVSVANPSLEDAFVELTGLQSELMFQEKEGGR